MSLVAGVENGKIVTSTSQSSLSGVTGSSGDMDKDSFLQLLVAQMKYQDPLQPTSNTEYISQYAQFTQVEEMQSMSSSMDLMRASGLVGKEVYMKVTSEATGDTSYVTGKVDYVVYEGGKAYLSIDESLYALDDLDTIVDGEYSVAYEMATELVNSINKLPSLNNVANADISTIEKLNEIYEGMNDYQKSFVAAEKVTSLKAYLAKAESLKAAGSGDAGNSEGTDGSGNVDAGEGEK